MPRDHVYKQLLLDIRAQITVDAGDTGKMIYPVPLSLIQRIRVNAVGRHMIKDYTPYMAWLQGSRSRGECVPWRYDQSAATDVFARAIVPIDFGILDSVNEGDFYLPSYMYDGIEFQIVWGDGTTDVHTSGNSKVKVGTTPTARLISHELDRKSLLEERGGQERVYLINKESELSQNITAADTDFRIEMATGNLYRSVYLAAFATPATGKANMPVNLNDLSEADPLVINNLKFDLGSGEIYHDLQQQTVSGLVSRVKRQNSLGAGWTIVGNDPKGSAAALRFLDPGIFRDFSENGTLSGCVNTAGRNTWRCRLDVATPVDANVPTPRRIALLTRELLPM